MMHKNHLKHMGITQWALRDTVVSDVPRFFSYALQNTALKSVGWLLADVADETIFSFDAQKIFVEKIVSALTPHFAALSCDEAIDNTRFVIVLGDYSQAFFLERHKNTAEKIIHTSLLELMQSPDAKKALWARIKPLRDHLT